MYGLFKSYLWKRDLLDNNMMLDEQVYSNFSHSLLSGIPFSFMVLAANYLRTTIVYNCTCTKNGKLSTLFKTYLTQNLNVCNVCSKGE